MIPVSMSSLRRLTGPGVGAALALAMGGCALLSTPDPVQLYRFGPLDGGYVGERSMETVQVSLRRIEFPDSVSGQRILAVTGNEAAYLAGARWVADAEQLYAQSLEMAFSSDRSGVRLIGGRELTRADAGLDVDITTFETRYATPGAAPTVVISARARLLAMPARTVVSEQVFSVSQPASDNRVGAIVSAYDAATQDLNEQIVAWVEANAARAASAD
ncbi:MAG: ABC-type transport auxiliary lipoprotein family protein [Brevundimonas sp.]|uniref:ABC-type transport auxiliary lipoprotein family protein n=1 Tax=Brevundimonas sp. TaxID=1871086 RepID=UPI00276928A4|nr:ABC-type transport auxiliary lipoprotein family protein [Brevundimonas sp.]MDP3399890.1 ABC-type transport auxiliary lipoprotein family protein [Brevundimonas sp.]MDZ4110333.1 ABC-type transport auxiliary lipoprotein family protein [Brevundimonas sp.]